MKKILLSLLLLLSLFFATNKANAANLYMYSYEKGYYACNVYYNTISSSYWENCVFSNYLWHFYNY